MASAKKTHTLPTAVWPTAGGNIPIDLRSIPALSRIRSFIVELTADFHTGAAQALIPGEQFYRLVDRFQLGSNILATGAQLYIQDWAQRGMQTEAPAGIPASNAAHFSRVVTWVIPYQDDRGVSPLDGSPTAAIFGSDMLLIQAAPFSALDGGAGTWSTLAAADGVTGTIRVWAELEEPNDSPGAIVQFGFMDLSGQTPTIPPGLYMDLFAYREDLSPITSAQIATIQVSVDGAPYKDSMLLREYLANWNLEASAGAGVGVSSATVPLGGESLPDEPAVTAGATQVVSTPWVPIIWRGRKAKLTHDCLAERALELRYTGTDTSLRVAYRRHARRSPSDVVLAFNQIGRLDVTSPDMVVPKTASKAPLRSGKQAFGPYFPLRARTPRR
jgi:hypothetical protein